MRTTSLDKKMLEDYGFSQDTMVIYCDNYSTISISKNHMQHSRIKYIDIRHHFIRLSLIKYYVIRTCEHLTSIG
jgi:hypothetical protein